MKEKILFNPQKLKKNSPIILLIFSITFSMLCFQASISDNQNDIHRDISNEEIKQIEDEEVRISAGSDYFVDNIDGNDDKDGCSEMDAWKTIKKVNSISFKPGDSILFKRGGIWREFLEPESGNITNNITYGAYGTGPKPQILGSMLRNKTTDWFNEVENIWSTNKSQEIGIQLLLNPSFDSDINGWTFYNDSLSNANCTAFYDLIRYDTSPGSLGINCTTRGTHYTEISLRADNVKIIEGCLYNFSFRAKCTQAFNISTIEILNNNNPYYDKLYSHASNQTPTITTNWKTYNVLFRATSTSTTAWLVLFFGDKLPEGETFNIDTCSFKMIENDILFYADVGNLIFNREESCGIKVWNESDLDVQGEFWYDKQNWIVKIYSKENPASNYTEGIECCLGKNIINEENCYYIIYEDLHLMYGGAHGIGGGNTSNIIIRRCDFSYIGGSELPILIYKNIRFGNAIEFWSNASDNLVEFCRIWEIYDAAITNQGTENNNIQQNLIYRNNTIWNCEYSIEIWNQPSNSRIKKVYFENNTCVNAGFGWSNSQRYDPMGRHLLLGYCTANVTDVFIRYNIFYETQASCIFIENNTWPTQSLNNVTLDYNKYYSSTSTNYMIYYKNDKYTITQFSDYQNEQQKDLNSIFLSKQKPEIKNILFNPEIKVVGTIIKVLAEIGALLPIKSVLFEFQGNNNTMNFESEDYTFSWAANNAGIFDYRIFALDLAGNLNSYTGKIIIFPQSSNGNDDNDDNGGEEPVISFGYYYLLFSFITILGIIITSKKFRRLTQEKK